MYKPKQKRGRLKPLFCHSLEKIQIDHVVIFINARLVTGMADDLCQSLRAHPGGNRL